MTAEDRARGWNESYAGAPPWDIGRPQPIFAKLAAQGAFAGDVLDVGCGTGEHTLLVSSTGANALGIDIAPLAIERARAKANERGVAARFEVGDALALNQLGTQFDVVIDSGLFHSFDVAERPVYVASLAGATRAGGRCYIACFSDKEPAGWGPRRITETEIADAFASGWNIESIEAASFEVTPAAPVTQASAWLVTLSRKP
jgi:SAM-dependent methyltransferase